MQCPTIYKVVQYHPSQIDRLNYSQRVLEPGNNCVNGYFVPVIDLGRKTILTTYTVFEAGVLTCLGDLPGDYSCDLTIFFFTVYRKLK